MKRGEMSIGIIVGLAIALIVLILIIGILVPRFSLFGKGTNQAQTDLEKRTCAKIGHCESQIDPTRPTCTTGTLKPKPTEGWIDCTGACCVP
ncbi:MAG TPA: hypothetical protein VLJ21_04915 [Candidatus Binatia bacterium]|nr:hypothetical protein [Candidatus Binatia bacterium]